MANKYFLCKTRLNYEKFNTPCFIEAEDIEEAKKKFKNNWGTRRKLLDIEEDIETELPRLFKITYYTKDKVGESYGCDGQVFYKHGYILSTSFHNAWEDAERTKGLNDIYIWPKKIKELSLTVESLVSELLII